MGSQISSYLLYFAVGLTAIMWSLVIVPIWARAADRRGGKWYLEAILLICGPISTATIAMYPRGPGATLSGPFPAINSALVSIAVVLAAIALFQGLKQPRKHAGPVIAATGFFYLALVLSCFAGVAAGFPEPYWTTPLVVMAFLVHGGFTFEWFLGVARVAMRMIIVLSFLALLNPQIGFNYDDSRAFAGLARMQGITVHPNTFAYIAVIGLLLEMRAGSALIWRILNVAALLLAQSNTAFVMAAIGVLIVATRMSAAIRFTAGAAAFLFACVALFDPAWAGRVIDSAVPTSAGTLNGRTAIWRAVTYGFESNPIFGYGPGLLGDDYRARYLPHFDAAAQAHSQWYQTLGGTGIVGVASLAILAVVAFVFAMRFRKATSRLPLALLAVTVIRGITETPLRPSGVSISTFCLVIVLGLIAAATSKSDDQQVETDEESESISRPSGVNAKPHATRRPGAPRSRSPKAPVLSSRV